MDMVEEVLADGEVLVAVATLEEVPLEVAVVVVQDIAIQPTQRVAFQMLVLVLLLVLMEELKFLGNKQSHTFIVTIEEIIKKQTYY